jgi:4-amino-4-deoxy-L-arabinose transferase-like glycosyltransferase
MFASSLTAGRIVMIWSGLAIAALYVVGLLMRPALPIDETRYLTVAWEMYVRHDWLAPLTVNFQPYHHKPPLLFWLINAAWSVFGASRWAAMLPSALMSAVVAFLTLHLARALFPQNRENALLAPVILIGSVPFVIYGNLIMFDITLCAFVLATFLSILAYKQSGRMIHVLLAGLWMGLGVLTKGPVAWLYIMTPLLLGPVWLQGAVPRPTWYYACISAFILSLLPVVLWLIPVLRASDSHFVFWLLWEQTAGRVTGHFQASHARPFYFYLPLLPLMMMPWILTPRLWRQAKSGFNLTDPGYGFLLSWLVPLFVMFSLISGKQPHYLLPLLPGVAIFTAMTASLTQHQVLRTATCTVLVCIVFQIGGSKLLSKYDLTPIATLVRHSSTSDIAVAQPYHGEFSFLAGLHKKLDEENRNSLPSWFVKHPQGIAIVRFDKDSEVANYRKLFEMPYRNSRIGLFVGQYATEKLIASIENASLTTHTD